MPSPAPRPNRVPQRCFNCGRCALHTPWNPVSGTAVMATASPSELTNNSKPRQCCIGAACIVCSTSCSYSHGLRDCWQPRNAAAVTAARAEFTAASGPGTIMGQKLPSRYLLCTGATPALKQHHMAAARLADCPWLVVARITPPARDHPWHFTLHIQVHAAHRYFTSMTGASDTSEAVQGDGTTRLQGDGEPAPGQLSAELRAALGIAPSAPPPWLARMRRLGYPPGYIVPETAAAADAGDNGCITAGTSCLDGQWAVYC